MPRLAHLYPLRGLPRQGQIWSWISFDVANQSFTLIINTLLFSLFFQQVAAANVANVNTWWGGVFAVSMLLVVLASPVAGAIADARAMRKLFLVGSGFGCALLTCALGLIQPGQLWLAILLYVPANFLFNIGENFLASFLPQLSTRKSVGKVSGFSWGVAYCSALLMLAIIAGVMLQWNLKDPGQWRPFFVAAGLWFLLFVIPTLLFLKEGAAPRHGEGKANLIVEGLQRLRRTLGEVGRFRDLAMLLLASFFYGGGMSVIVSFASIIAQDFGIEGAGLVIYVAIITVSGIAGTLIPTLFSDRLGHKRMTLILLALWVFTCVYLAFVAWHLARQPAGTPEPAWPIWLAGNLLGLGLGSLGAANRAFVGYLTPVSRSAEFFGLWGLVFKLAAILVIPFAIAKDAWGMAPALMVLAAMLVVGLVLTLFVDEARGARAAQEQADSPS